MLGFAETWRGSRDGQTLNWVNLKVPDGEEYIEFMLHSAKPHDAGSDHHICLMVPSVEKAAAELAMRPYNRPLQPRTGINRKRQLNLFDADGTRTELMEASTVDGKPAPAAYAPPPIP